LNWKKLREHINFLNEVRYETLKKSIVKLRVLFKISGYPPLWLYIDKNGIKIDEKENSNEESAEITIAGNMNVLGKIKKNNRRYWNLFKALLMRELKIRGKLSKIFSLYKNLWILEEIFSGEIA
jgi:hypothetical protein